VEGQQVAAFLVALADDAWRVGRAVEDFLGEQLDEGALFLDDEDLLEPAREVADVVRLQRVEHADLEDAHAGATQGVVVQAHLHEGLAQVVVGLAGGDDAQPGVGVGERDLVEAVFARIQAGELLARVVQRALHVERVLAHVHAEVDLGRVGAAVELDHRGDELQAVGVDDGAAAAVGDVGDDLEARPQARDARQVVAVQAEVEDVLHVARVQRGDADVVEHGLRLTRQRGRLAARVVAEDGEHATIAQGAGVVGVLERVARAVYARRLAVPGADHAVELLLAHRVHHLGAPDGGGGEVLVEAVDELDVVLQQQLLLLDEVGVQHAHGRAAVAGDEHGVVQTAAAVEADLVHRQAHQRLDAPDVDDPLFCRELPRQVLFGRHRCCPS